MPKEMEHLRRKLEDLEPQLQELSLKSAQSDAKAMELITGMERRLEERIVGQIQGLAQGRVAALEEALMDSDETARNEISSLNLTLSGLGESLSALESKVKKSFAALESKTKQSLSIIGTKLQNQKSLHHSPQETAGNSQEAAGNCGSNPKQPDQKCEMLERLQSLEAELQHLRLASMKLVERRVFALEDELGQQKKGYDMLVSQFSGWLDMQQKAGTKNGHVEAPQNPQAPPTAEAGWCLKDQPRLYSRSQRQRPNAVLHHEPQLRVSPNRERPTPVIPVAQLTMAEMLDKRPDPDIYGPPTRSATPRSPRFSSPFSRYSCMFS